MFKCVNKENRTEFPSDLTVPTNFAMGTPTSTAIPVTWTAPTQGTASGYRVYEGTTLMKRVDWPATGTTVTGLTASTSYTFYVVTYDSVGESSDSTSDTATTAAAAAGIIFEDAFSSGDLLSTNVDGFDWLPTNRTGVVTGDPTCGGYGPADDVFLWDSNASYCLKETAPLNGGSFDAKEGVNNLRFRYPAYDSGSPGAGALSEQRFLLGTQQPTLWMSYWLKVPSNWNKSNGIPSSATNNKLGVFGWGISRETDANTNYAVGGGWGLASYNSVSAPLSGKWNANNATPSSITLVRINDINDVGSDKGSGMNTIEIGIPMVFTQRDDTTKSIRFIVDSITDNTTYHSFGVTYESTGVGGVPDVLSDTDMLTWPNNEFRIELKDRPDDIDPANMKFELQTRTMSDATHALSFQSFDDGSYGDFITEADQNKWMHMVFDWTASTDIDTPDGHIRVYRMWEGEGTYTLIGAIENTVIASGGRNRTGWGYGYLMGYANVEYIEQTEWFIDDFKLSTTDLKI